MVEIEWCAREWDLWLEKILRKMLFIWIAVDFKRDALILAGKDFESPDISASIMIPTRLTRASML